MPKHNNEERSRLRPVYLCEYVKDRRKNENRAHPYTANSVANVA